VLDLGRYGQRRTLKGWFLFLAGALWQLLGLLWRLIDEMSNVDFAVKDLGRSLGAGIHFALAHDRWFQWGLTIGGLSWIWIAAQREGTAERESGARGGTGHAAR
jgi:hypothetical protein